MLERFQKPNTEGSIFSDELAEADKAQPKRHTPAGAASTPIGGSANKSRAGASLDPEHSARAVDPDPRARVRWERKMVIRSIRNGTNPWARESKDARIKRTERQMISKSPFLPTSGKKLVHLAHQIQGKTLDDALLQMRFSPKKMAREVAVQLKLARDLAVVERGMGLGHVNGETQAWRQEIKKVAAAAGSAVSQPGNSQQMALAVVNGKQAQAGVKIQTKDKKWLHIDDPTRLYVSEAWIGKGPLRFRRLEYRARGRANVLKSPSTCKWSS
jgi:ribosomal protein L22